MACTASWLGHEFAALELTDLTETEPRIPAYPGLDEHRNDSTLHYKYIPQTGAWGEGGHCTRLLVASWEAHSRKTAP